MTTQYKEEDIIIYYEGDKTTQIVPGGITYPNNDKVWKHSSNWHIAVRSGEGVVKFIEPRSWNSDALNPTFQMLHGYDGWPATEDLIKPLEFFTKETLQNICKLTNRIELNSKDTKKQIIKKICKTAVSVFNEVERKSNPDLWEIGEVVIRDNRLPCVIVDKTEGGLRVAFWMSLKEISEGQRTDYPLENCWECAVFNKLEEVDRETLIKVYDNYVNESCNGSVCSTAFLVVQIRHYGESIYCNYKSTPKLDDPPKKCLFDRMYDQWESENKNESGTLEVDMRDVNDIIESMTDAIDFIKAKSGASLDDQKVWKQLQRSIARIEATIKYGPH